MDDNRFGYGIGAGDRDGDLDADVHKFILTYLAAGATGLESSNTKADDGCACGDGRDDNADGLERSAGVGCGEATILRDGDDNETVGALLVVKGGGCAVGCGGGDGVARSIVAW